MENVFIKFTKTEKGYSATCDLLPGSVITYTGDFEGFMEFVQESIDFEIDCAKEDNEDYPDVFKGEYEIGWLCDDEKVIQEIMDLNEKD